MNDIYVRSRSPRRKQPDRRRKKNYREQGTAIENIIRQAVLSVLILTLIGIVKNVNTKPTRYMSDKVKQSISYNINPKDIYKGASNIIARMTGKNADVPDDGDAIPAGAGLGWIQGNTGDSSNAGGTAKTVTRSEAGFISPVDGNLVSGFGNRNDPFTGAYEYHWGIDIKASAEGSVKAVQDGEVVETGTRKEYGKFIRIRHTTGLVTVYANCDTVAVESGKKVKKGDLIAKVQSNSVLPDTHLHFEVWNGNQVLNPLDYINVAE